VRDLAVNGVCAVIISYNPGDYLISNVRALRSQVDEIIVVDNGSGGDSRNILDTVSKVEGVKVSYNNANLGIAAALNIGVKFAMDAGYKWVATFDQDSKVTPGFISSMFSAYESCKYKDLVAIISPVYYDPAIGKYCSFGRGKRNPATSFIEVETTMTSWNLIPIHIFSKVGLFDEAFFIDYVDHEFCLRCLASGFKIIESQRSVLYHRLGEPVQHKFLWKHLIVTNHNPLRRYYNTRNRIVVWERYFLVKPGWVIRDVISLVKEMLKIVLYERDVAKKIFFIIKGTYHGFIGKLGKYP